MRRRCVICGAEFDTPPSNNRSTCSPECSSIWRGQRHLGLRFRKSEAARGKARAAAGFVQFYKPQKNTPNWGIFS